MARPQRTTIAADSPGINRLAPVTEPLLDGEIAVRRQLAGEGGGPVVAPPAHAAPPSAPDTARQARADPSVQVDQFERIEDYLRAYLEHERFSAIHPLACGRWIVAWELLWCADSRAKVIAVAHRAHEAMRAFATSLVEHCMPLPMDTDWPDLLADASQRPEPLEALLTITQAYRRELGEDRRELLQALLEQWRALLETVQRHEQRPQAADRRLSWEDGRRLVLFTALVMVETDRSFS